MGSNESTSDDPWMAKSKMGSKYRTFELDTGAHKTVIPLSYRDSKYKMLAPDIKLESANEPLDLHGMQIFPISRGQQITEQKVYLAADVRTALLG